MWMSAIREKNKIKQAMKSDDDHETQTALIQHANEKTNCNTPFEYILLDNTTTTTSTTKARRS